MHAYSKGNEWRTFIETRGSCLQDTAPEIQRCEHSIVDKEAAELADTGGSKLPTTDSPSSEEKKRKEKRKKKERKDPDGWMEGRKK